MRNVPTPFFIIALAALSVPRVARADVPPPDTCTTVGDACQNAGPSQDQPGTCQVSTCTRATPTGSTTYDCNRCMPGASAGGSGAGGSASGGADAEGGAGAPGSGGGAAQPSKTQGGGGCTVSMPGSHTGRVAALFGLGLGAAALRRRR